MAEIKNIDMRNGGIEISLSMSREEYRILKHHMTNLIILPSGKESLTYELTTGKLGNSNRIMVPKKMLDSFQIRQMNKKVPSNIFIMNDDAYLLVRIKKSELGIPNFEVE